VPPAERLVDGRIVGAHDEQFHATLVRAAGNGEMARVHRVVTERIRIIRRLDFTRPDRIEATCAEHAKVLRAVIPRPTRPDSCKITLHTLQAARQRGDIRMNGRRQGRNEHAR
jgi:DNA-binding GntR family transcriptional regulator